MIQSFFLKYYVSRMSNKSCNPCETSKEVINNFISNRQLTSLIPPRPFDNVSSQNRCANYFTENRGRPRNNAHINAENALRQSQYKVNGVSCDCGTNFANA